MSKLQPASAAAKRFPDPRHAPKDGPLLIDTDLSVETLLEAYRLGYYPKPEHHHEVQWWCPDPRTVLFLDNFKVSRSLRKSVKNRAYYVTLNRDFSEVIKNCAYRDPPRVRTLGHVTETTLRSGRLDWLIALHEAGRIHLQYDGAEQTMQVTFKSQHDASEILGPVPTWITWEIQDAYQALHRQGHAHSVETWRHDDLVGGLYGVGIGQIFFGESMFSTSTDASKVALFHLVEHLRKAGFVMIDCQEPTELLFSLGATEISRSQYLDILSRLVVEKTPHLLWKSLSTQQFATHPDHFQP